MSTKSFKPPFRLRLNRLFISILSGLNTSLAARWVNYLWFKTHHHPLPMREQNWVGLARQTTITFNKAPLALLEWKRNGPKILLVHGWNGRASQMGAMAMPLFTAGFHVIAMDAPAHGLNRGNKTDLPEFSAAIEAVLSQKGPFEGLVAHSFGGLAAALALYQKNSVELKRLVLISTPIDVQSLLDNYSEMLKLSDEVAQRHKNMLEKKYKKDLWDIYSIRHLVKNIDIPTLIFHDQDDQFVPIENGEQTAQSFDKGHFIKTQQLGHHRILRNQGVTAQIVQFFRSENTLASP